MSLACTLKSRARFATEEACRPPHALTEWAIIVRCDGFPTQKGLGVLGDLRSHAVHGDRKVDEAGSDGGIGHDGMPRPMAVGHLRKSQPARFLDGFRTQRAIAIGPRQDD